MDDGHALGCSQSYAKNMGLYGQRIGCFSIITEEPKEAVKVESQMKVSVALSMFVLPVPCCVNSTLDFRQDTFSIAMVMSSFACCVVAT